MTILYNNVALIGLGLIASSIGHGLKKNGLCKSISGYAKTSKTRKKAIELNIVDKICETAKEAVIDADLIIISTPIGVMGEIAKEIAPALKKGATLTDVGSVKEDVISLIEPYLPSSIHFIPGHPVAGTERSGPESGFAELFYDRWCLLTPVPNTDQSALSKLIEMWKKLGARVDTMDAKHHDLVLAVTSHSPHLIAYTMVGVADDLRRVTNSEVVNYSAAGFRDFTRIAASDPTMWRDVFLHNKDATLEILGRFTEELFSLQRAIRKGDGDFLHEYFSRTRKIRRGIVEAGQDTDSPDFGRRNLTEIEDKK
jgi:cyclohexadieny/prephenate dehydrogenase